MQFDLAKWLKTYLSPDARERAHLVALYRPLIRLYCAIVALYYLIIGVCLTPFLDGGSSSIIILFLRLWLGLVAAGLFYLTRRAHRMVHFEWVVAVISLHILCIFSLNHFLHANERGLVIYVLLIALMGAASPSFRVLVASLVAGVTVWLWIVSTHYPALLSANISQAIVACVVSAHIWGLINTSLRSASRAIVTAERRGDEMERFAYICSHDMQEPLRMMNAYAGFLTEQPRPNEADWQRYAQLIRSNAVRMSDMVRDILTFSRVGREGVKFENVNTNAVVAETLGEFLSEIADKDVKISCGSLPEVKTSLTLMRMVFYNLISNAIKFQDGTKVPVISITAEPDKDMWRFIVRDNGIGIDPAKKDVVFTLFQRLNRKEDYPGTGIGLSTCRKFLQLCGGHIDFEAETGGGTCFWFTLPKTPPASAGNPDLPT